MAMESQTFFSAENRVAPLGIVPLAGARELSEKVEAHLVRWAKRAGMDVDTFIIENSVSLPATARALSSRPCAAMTCSLL